MIHMKICIDTRSPGKTGILSYMTCLLSHMISFDTNNEYVIITDPEFGSWGFKDIEEIVVPSNNPIHWFIWSNTVLPKILKEKKIDIYHSLKHITAFYASAKKIVTLHGVHLHYMMPELFKRHETLYWKIATSIALREYDRIVTVAFGERNFFVEKKGYPEEKFRVTHTAGNERFSGTRNEDKLRKTKDRYKLESPYILSVSRIHPIKNLDGAIEGYSIAKRKTGTRHKLVIAGGGTGSYLSKISNLVSQLDMKDDVQFLGHVPNEDLPDIYNQAEMFLLPSHYETFSIVLIEAMVCGLPVITSDIEDIKEVVGDAAMLVNPKNKHEIADAIVRILSSDELKKDLRAKSLARSKMFSWDRCAAETLKVYEELYSIK